MQAALFLGLAFLIADRAAGLRGCRGVSDMFQVNKR